MKTKPIYEYRVGDIVEDILMPSRPTARGGEHVYGKEWFFRLWRATVTECDDHSVVWEVHESRILQPDDPRVIAWLKEHYTPSDKLFEECGELLLIENISEGERHG